MLLEKYALYAGETKNDPILAAINRVADYFVMDAFVWPSHFQ
jgi:hypothetical protein